MAIKLETCSGHTFFVVLSQARGINDAAAAAVDLTMVASNHERLWGQTSPTSHNLGPLIVEFFNVFYLISSAEVATKNFKHYLLFKGLNTFKTAVLRIRWDQPCCGSGPFSVGSELWLQVGSGFETLINTVPV